MMCLRLSSVYKLQQPATVPGMLTEDLRPVVRGETISQSNPSLGTGLLRHSSHTAAVEGSDDDCKSVAHVAGET